MKNTGNTETSLYLAQWHRGDREALNHLLKRHLPWIFNKVRHKMGPMLRNKGDTEDYVQDAMVQFLQYGPRFLLANEQHFRALLLRIAENALRDKRAWFTARRRNIAQERPLPSDTLLSLDPHQVSQKSPSQHADENEKEAWIRFGMEFLDPENQEIIVLRQWDELSFVEIGKRLEITSNAARKRHNNAVKNLAEAVWALQSGKLNQILEPSSE